MEGEGRRVSGEGWRLSAEATGGPRVPGSLFTGPSASLQQGIDALRHAREALTVFHEPRRHRGCDLLQPDPGEVLVAVDVVVPTRW